MSEKEQVKHGIKAVLDRFLRRIDSLAGTLPLTMIVINAVQRSTDEAYTAFAEDHVVEAEEGEGVYVKQDKLRQFKRLSRRLSDSSIALEIVPRSFLAALVGQYDAFLGNLISELLNVKPEILNGSDRNLTYSQLTEFESMEDARRYVVEKEVESVLRKSHSSHFDWLEAKFGIPLRKGLDVWPTFIELTERRNLFAHIDGVVSSQYLDVCSEHGALRDGVAFGDRLRVDPDYFEEAFNAVYELAVKLTHVLWRKLIPGERGKADWDLVDITYNLLEEERYELARVIADFSLVTLKTHESELTRRTLVINRAQAYKWLGDRDTAIQIVEDEDWSAMSDKFHLAVAVVKDEFDAAERVMRKIGVDSDELPPFAYKDWPLFKEFRKSDQFLAAYKDMTGDEFKESEVEAKLELDGSTDSASDQSAPNPPLQADEGR